MLGPPQTRDLDRPVLIAIESSVPKDHFYRHLHRVLDLAFVRDLAVGCYASDGRPPSIPKSSSASKRWEILEECRLDPERPSGQRVSTTDPDAALMKPRGERACLGYHDHYVVDGGKARIILHALVTPANIMENTPMLDQLRRVIFRRRLRPKRVIADTTYGTIENVRAYGPLPDWEHQRPFYGPAQFAYDAGRDRYVCPQGTPLRPFRRERSWQRRSSIGRRRRSATPAR